MKRRPFAVLARLAVATSALATLASACSSASSGTASAGDAASGVPEWPYEEYVVSGDLANVGDIESITFVDGEHYTLERTTGSEDEWLESGTYVLDVAAGTLALADSDTGNTETIPFMPGDVASGPPVTFEGESLHVLGGTLTGSGGPLTSGSGTQLTKVQPLCSFASSGSKGTKTFQSTQSNCAKQQGLTPSGAGVFLTQNGKCVPAVFQSFDGAGSPAKVFATIKTVPDAATTAAYAPHLPAGFPKNNIPSCFIDMNDVVDGLTGATLGKNVKVSEHYTLAQLTQSGATPDEFVILDNQAVRYLEKFASMFGAPTVTSAFRGPAHQTAVCMGMCGAISCCGSRPQVGNCTVTCAKTSRHMMGKAFDLNSSYLKSQYINGACTSGFTFVYDETSGGPHLHIDTSQPAGSCVKQGV
jgi:hypothetical protein